MTTTTATTDTTTEAEAHRAELAAVTTQGARVRYARRVLGPEATGPQVGDWLAGHGYKVGRSTLYANLNTAEATDTTELPRLTAEQLAELGAALSAPAAPEAAAEAAEVPVAAPADPAPAEVPEAAPAAPEAAEAAEAAGPESGPVAGPAVRPEPESEGPAVGLDSGPVRSESGVQSDPGPVRVQSGPESGPSPESSPAESSPGVQSRPESGPSPVRSESSPVRGPESGPAESESPAEATGPESGGRSRLVVWPVMLMALAAFVTIWSGWVGLGEMTGFGMVQPLPGISGFQLNTAITLPIGVEAYASYALYVWLSGRASGATARFAQMSAFGALTLGAAGQVAYHLMAANGMKVAPWWITTFVSTLPVIVVGMGAALAHMVIRDRK